jgi:hypothetical protein
MDSSINEASTLITCQQHHHLRTKTSICELLKQILHIQTIIPSQTWGLLWWINFYGLTVFNKKTWPFFSWSINVNYLYLFTPFLSSSDPRHHHCYSQQLPNFSIFCIPMSEPSFKTTIDKTYSIDYSSACLIKFHSLVVISHHYKNIFWLLSILIITLILVKSLFS